jgi:hypothetical protein
MMTLLGELKTGLEKMTEAHNRIPAHYRSTVGAFKSGFSHPSNCNYGGDGGGELISES